MNKTCVNVSGIANAQVKTSLKNSLDKIEGVQEVGINKAEGTIEVEFNQPATANQIKSCINKCGCEVK